MPNTWNKYLYLSFVVNLFGHLDKIIDYWVAFGTVVTQKIGCAVRSGIAEHEKMYIFGFVSTF